MTFITWDAPAPLRDRTRPRHSLPLKLIARRCVQGILWRAISSGHAQDWMRSAMETIKSLRDRYSSGLPSTIKQNELPNCTSNPIFRDPITILVCDAINAHYGCKLAAQVEGEWRKPSMTIDRGSNYYLFLAACSIGDKAFIQLAYQALGQGQRVNLNYLSGVTAWEDWQEAFRFLADQGYDTNQRRGGGVLFLPKPPPVISAVITGHVEFLRLVLEYPCGLIKTGKFYQQAVGMALNLKDQSKGKVMADLLYSHGQNLPSPDVLREEWKPRDYFQAKAEWLARRKQPG